MRRLNKKIQHLFKKNGISSNQKKFWTIKRPKRTLHFPKRFLTLTDSNSARSKALFTLEIFFRYIWLQKLLYFKIITYYWNCSIWYFSEKLDSFGKINVCFDIDSILAAHFFNIVFFSIDWLVFSSKHLIFPFQFQWNLMTK